jgi:hypothetical protein
MTDSKQYQTTEPIFRLKPLTYNTHCELKHVGYFNEGDSLGDEIVELSTTDEDKALYGENTLFISSVMKYNITVNIYKNNFKGSFLLQNTFLPVFSIDLSYAKNIVGGFLFSICLGLELNEYSLNLLKTPAKCVNARIEGTYYIRLLAENFNQGFMDKLSDYVQSDPEVVAQFSSLSEEEFLLYYKDRLASVVDFYEKFKTGIILEQFTTQSKLISNIVEPLIKDYRLRYFILHSLELREQKRRAEYNAIESYSIPKKVLNIKDLEQNNIDEYLEKHLENKS